MKVDFIDEDHFTICYFYEEELKTEEEMKVFFKLLNRQLQAQYDYEFAGFYTVDIYCNHTVFILDFVRTDDYGRADFDITMLLNSVLLYEFEEEETVLADKVYYQGKYYTEIENIISDIHLFEYGTIIYGKRVEEVLNMGVLIPMKKTNDIH